MSKDIKEFPDLSNKLAAPSKKSLFERQRAEAEAKRAREEAETAAVYKDFVASFEDEEEDDAISRLGGGGRGAAAQSVTRGGFASSGGGAKRYFAPQGPRSLNSGPGSLGHFQTSRKRPFDGAFKSQRDREGDKDRGILNFDDGQTKPGGLEAATAFQPSDEEDEKAREDRAEERAAPKPTLQLTQLPPGTSPAVIKALIPVNLTVDNVRMIPAGEPVSTERRSMSAIVTLAKDTPASDLDASVSALQNRYLGYGFYLDISRHLSSAALGGSMRAPSLAASTASLPFGARAQRNDLSQSFNRGAPPGLRGQFAPPPSYNAAFGQPNRNMNAFQVNVRPPSDIKQLKLIHKTIESLLIHGPEFEALLMSRPEVQQDEKWAWIWDPRSTGGVWYRWRLWQVLTGAGVDKKLRTDAPKRIFDVGAPWQPPNRDDGLKFEWTTKFSEFISEDDYDSSDEEDSDDEGRKRRQQRQQGRNAGAMDISSAPQELVKSYLDPLHKAKLTHLLARLPMTTGKLRKGDVARVTAFAISHAGSGADEVVDMLVSNVETPYSCSGANGDTKVAGDDSQDEEDAVPSSETKEPDEKKGKEQDQTSSKLIGLFLISDVLSSSSTSGVRHAWRYRQLFENALKQRDTFARLGRLEKDLKWGRLRAEKWRRSVDSILRLWEGWSAFQQEAQKDFVEAFNNPPLTEEEQAAEQQKEKEKSKREQLAASRWKSVEENVAAPRDTDVLGDQQMVDVGALEAEALSDVDVEALLAAEDSDGDPFSDEDVDGEPMEDSDVDADPVKDTDVIMKDAGAPEGSAKAEAGQPAEQNPAVRSRRQRPRAVDMFADSDGE